MGFQWAQLLFIKKIKCFNDRKDQEEDKLHLRPHLPEIAAVYSLTSRSTQRNARWKDL